MKYILKWNPEELQDTKLCDMLILLDSCSKNKIDPFIFDKLRVSDLISAASYLSGNNIITLANLSRAYSLAKQSYEKHCNYIHIKKSFWYELPSWRRIELENRA
jgi:hypothetical protein